MIHRRDVATASEKWPAGPARPHAAAGQLDIWRAELDPGHWPGPEGLPAVERERAARMLRPDAARRWVAARWALRRVLSLYLGEPPEAIRLAAGERGKPALAAAPERLSFNLSHSAELALVAVTAGVEVGIDVELVEERRDLVALAERGLGQQAAAAVRATPPERRLDVFHEAWVRHEAHVKCLGGSVFETPGKGPVAIAPITPGSGYAAAVAVAAAAVPRLRTWTISWA